MTENITNSDILTTEWSNNEAIHTSGQIRYIIVPLAVILTVLLLSIAVYLMAKKRKLETLRHRLMPLYSFDKNEQSNWETEFLNSVDNPNYTEYNTTNFMKYED